MRELPLQRRFTAFKKIADALYLYRQDSAYDWGHSCRLAKINPQTADIALQSGLKHQELEKAIDAGTADKLVRKHLLKDHFGDLATAREYAIKNGRITELCHGRWRTTVKVNGCTLVTYGIDKDDVLHHAVTELIDIFPMDLKA